MNLMTQAIQAVTNDGGISINWILGVVVTIILALIGVIFGFILSRINSIADDVKTIRDDFHKFTEKQAGINSELQQKTRDL